MKKYLALIVIITLISGCASLKPNPRPWTKKEKTAAGFFMTAHTANYFSSKAIVHSPYCYESNFIMGQNPSDGKIGFYFSITGAMALGIAHYWPNTRVPLLMGYGGINLFFTVYDYSSISDQERKYEY